MEDNPQCLVSNRGNQCHLVKLLTHPKLPTDRRDEAFRIAAAHDLLDHFDDFDFWGTTPNEAEGAV